MFNNNEGEVKINRKDEAGDQLQNEQIQLNLTDDRINNMEINKSYFMDIHIDAMFHEIDQKSHSKQIIYPNLQNVQVHINSCSLRQINFRYLRECFNNIKQPKKLLIFLEENGNMDFNSFNELKGIFQSKQTLNELFICIEPNNIHNQKSLKALCEGIKCLNQLIHLKFIIKRQQYSPMDKQSIQHIGGFLKQLSKIVNLTLYLSCNVSDNCSFNKEVSIQIQSLQELQKFILVIEYNQPNKQASPEGIISIFKAVSHLKNLKHFSLSMKKISISPVILQEAFKYLPSLQSFNFFNKFLNSKNQNWKIQEQSCLQKVFPCLFNNLPSKVQTKYFDIFSHLYNIQNLSFNLLDLNEEGLISLGQGFKNFVSLQTLSILINPQSQEGNLKTLPISQTNLFEFQEDYVSKGDKVSVDEGIGSLAEGFSYLANLKELKLKIDHFKIFEKGAEYLKNGFKHFKTLNSLSLKIGDNYGGQGCFFKILMQGIQNIDTLQILDLDISQFIFSTENTQGLSECFKNFKNLTNLSLSFTRRYYIFTTDNQISCICDIIKYLTELNVLKLTVSYAGSSSVISSQLLQYIKKIKVLYLDISDPEINKQDLLKLSQGLVNCKQLSFLYFKLQTNKEDMYIFNKNFLKLLMKKIKHMKKLVKYQYNRQ